ncbi:hypothetical protein B0H17DRAFT_1230199 [Mycena rosella]|uniref:Uncharacterized protein n=1 Tax=Mycena rosella TaxID=1033263 RepID=A0AAD7GCG7_MYCRO|nr:hypothetical protein B0H17DRAFT_1230199 [Mycena rosella]
MDSQLTLVTATPRIYLKFGSDSMINTTIFMNSRPAYTLSTALQGSTTDLSASRMSELLARISRKEILPNTIAFPSVNNGKEIRLSKWMSRQKLSDGLHVHLIETEIGKCFLRKHSVHRLAVLQVTSTIRPSPSVWGIPIPVDQRQTEVDVCGPNEWPESPVFMNYRVGVVPCIPALELGAKPKRSTKNAARCIKKSFTAMLFNEPRSLKVKSNSVLVWNSAVGELDLLKRGILSNGEHSWADTDKTRSPNSGSVSRNLVNVDAILRATVKGIVSVATLVTVGNDRWLLVISAVQLGTQIIGMCT